MNILDAFLHLYFYQIETILNNNDTEIKSVKFHSEEANTDEYLKLFFKSFLTKNNIINDNFIYDVKISKSDIIKHFNISQLREFVIDEVLLPIELTSKHREAIQKQKTSIYTKPDLYIKISNGSCLKYISVELKSTKNDKIPGSSVQQVSPYEWVIFVQHKDNYTKVVTGMYINSITEKLSFPDRSPRPEIGFNILSKWNSSNRIIVNNTLEYTYPNNTSSKEQILDNWHEYLTKKWLDIVKKETRNKNEQWFNHTIRLYSAQLLEYYESISEKDKMILKKSLNKLVKEFNDTKLNEV